MLEADILAQFLCDNEISAIAYGDHSWIGHHVDIAKTNHKRSYVLRLDIYNLKVRCDTERYFWWRHSSRPLQPGYVSLADPDSLIKILKAVRECTTGNCASCILSSKDRHIV